MLLWTSYFSLLNIEFDIFFHKSIKNVENVIWVCVNFSGLLTMLSIISNYGKLSVHFFQPFYIESNRLLSDLKRKRIWIEKKEIQQGFVMS